MTNPRGPSDKNSLTQAPDTSLTVPVRRQIQLADIRVVPRFQVRDAIFETLANIKDKNIPNHIEELILEVGYGHPQTTDFLVSVYEAIGMQKFMTFTENLFESGEEILQLLDQHFDNKIEVFVNAVVQGMNYRYIGLSEEAFQLMLPKFVVHAGVNRIYIEAGKKGLETLRLLFTRIEGLDHATIWTKFEEANRNFDQFLSNLTPQNL
jgi:hypothetical protein